MNSRATTTTDIRSLISKLDKSCRQIVSQAADLAYRHQHAVLDIEHLLAAFFDVEDEPLLKRAVAAGFHVADAQAGLKRLLQTFKSEGGMPPALSDRLVGALRDAWLAVSLKPGNQTVSIEALLTVIMLNDRIYLRLLSDVPDLIQLALALQEGAKPHSVREIDQQDASLYSTLEKFTIDLTARAKAGDIDPVIGRDGEISQVVEILLRRRQNNPILTGEAGVGKTAIVEGLAQRIAAGLVPQALKNVRVCSLDMGLLRAGSAMRGEIESRIKAIIAEIATAEQPVILFIDEAHTLVTSAAGQAEQSDVANLIKPELARGTLRTIAATTWAEYKRYFEKDAALSRRFQTVRVGEPSAAVTVDILHGLVPVLQKHHGVYVMQSAVEAAVRLSSRYIQDRQLPDKAISVLDTACARAVASLTGPINEEVGLRQRVELLTVRLVALQNELIWTGLGADVIAAVQLELNAIQARLADASIVSLSSSDTLVQASNCQINESLTALPYPPVRVGSEEVASVIADWTGVPSQKMLQDQFGLAARLEETLAHRVVGQKAAVHIICDRVRAYSAKLEDPSRPIGVFMLTGPSGVGKTETAHALAEAFFGKVGITIVNMSEYQEAHTVSKLKGAPAGYVGYGQGGILTEAIRRQPYGLLLLDEVEKAHPDVLDLFLQVFDKGFMEDSEGIVVDFKNTLVLMTSNAGSELLESIGNSEEISVQDVIGLMPLLQQQLLRHFKPAFLGRTQVVPYFTLGETELRCIVKIKMHALCQRFQDSYREVLEFDNKVIDAVVAHCASRTIGARWIDQYISENILSRLSSYVLDCLSLGKSVPAVRIATCHHGSIFVEPIGVPVKIDVAATIQ